MSSPTRETILQPASIDEAANLQGRAFFDDPLFTWVFEEENDRRTKLPWLMRIGVTLGVRFGEVHTTAEPMRGNAVWLPPGGTHVDDERLASAGFADADRVLGEESLARFGTFMEEAARHHERIMPEPHWYLMILGVDPPHQGQGVGGQLLHPVLARADGEGLPCYLETAKERNLSFYVRHGFEVVADDALVGGGPRYWMMRRTPR